MVIEAMITLVVGFLIGYFLHSTIIEDKFKRLRSEVNQAWFAFETEEDDHLLTKLKLQEATVKKPKKAA